MPKRENGPRRMLYNKHRRRIRTYRVVWRNYTKAFSTINAFAELESQPRPDENQKKSLPAGRYRTEEQEVLVGHYNNILIYMRKKLIARNDSYWQDTKREIWRLAYEYAFRLANRLDWGCELWERMSEDERRFLESFYEILSYAKREYKINDENFTFTMGQIGCVLRCMKKGERTSHCPAR